MSFRLCENEAWDFIATQRVGYVTTLRRDGRPITVPVWHAAVDHRVYISSPANSTKLKRIARDPRAFFLVETGEAWEDLVAVSFEARATLVDDQALAARATAALDAKYSGLGPAMDRLPAPVRTHYASREIVELVPAGRINSWNNAALISD